jgi:type II secretory pathway component PulF
MLLESQAASLAEMLALLVEHQMPMPDALALAADATGDKQLIASARQLAAEISAGGQSANQPIVAVDKRSGHKRLPAGSIPPLLHWLIVAGASQPNLAAVLRQNANMYRRRAIARADWLRWRLPVILTVAIGGTATLIYALLLFVPWISVLKELTHT